MYSRRAAGRLLTFGVSGRLFRNAQVMYDRETGSLWSHLTGEALGGPLRGERLERIAAGVTPRITWRAWRRLYPHTAALSVDGRQDFPFDRYEQYRRDPARTGLYPVSHPDRRAAPKEMVLGVTLGRRRSKAYRHADLERRPLLADRVGDMDLLVYFDARGSGASAVFERPGGDGEPFRLEGDRIVAGDGKRWRAATGEPLSPRTPRLRTVPHVHAYWFAWADHHPGSALFP